MYQRNSIHEKDTGEKEERNELDTEVKKKKFEKTTHKYHPNVSKQHRTLPLNQEHTSESNHTE